MRHGRRDRNHTEIREALRAIGASVFDTGDVGGGFPDLVVGYRGTTYLVEIKSPNGHIRASQAKFRRNWRGGPVLVVRSVEDALRQIAS